MVESVIYGVKLSSVGPGRVTGQDVVQELNNMDLAMKLHYLRAVYYFRREALEGLSVLNIKEPMFTWFNHFSATCGRFRRPHDSHSGGPGRPFIKCNDCGARFIEAHSPYTLDECLQPLLLNHLHDHSLHNLLVSNQVIGPEIQFSPPVLLQFTWFKCGGVAVGLSWAHVLGDAFSAADFMNALGRVMAGHQLPPRPVKAQPQSRAGIDISRSPSPPTDPLSVKRVGPVGDHWICPNHNNNNTRAKMEAFSLHITAAQMEQLQSKVGGGGGDRIPFFEALCAVIWKCVAKTRTRKKDGDVAEEPKVVTICKNRRGRRQNENGGGGVVILSNAQGIGVVKADEDVSIAEAKPKQLAELLMMMMIGEESLEDERSKIEEAMEREGGLGDFVVYGANLTFVDLEEADLYGLELKGQRPVYATYSIDGVGDQGAVLVLPGPQETAGGGGGGIGKGKGKGKVVTLIMPDTEVVDLKSDLLTELFSMASS